MNILQRNTTQAKNILVAPLTMCVCVMSIPAKASFTTTSGFVRQEMAFNLSNDKNIFNQHGNPFNGKTVNNSSGFPGVEPLTRDIELTENDWNLMATRVEIDGQMRITDNVDAVVKLRGYFDHGIYEDYENPNFFEVPLHGDCATALEVCGDNYMIDLPSAYFDYNQGPLWLRVGNQQIAWGEALFFRVTDVANGLDLRRHNIFDWASEEYADERVAAPGVRGSYRLDSGWEIEAFVQQFTPSILTNENTPYNIVPSQFVVHQQESFDDVDGDLNAGVRVQGQIGELGLQFFGVSRRNPDGVYRWTESNVNAYAGDDNPMVDSLTGNALPIIGAYGEAFGISPTLINFLGEAIIPFAAPLLGDLLAGTPFEPNPQGVASAEEWFYYAGQVRLDGVEGVNVALDEFPVAGIAGDIINSVACSDITDERARSSCTLDSLFSTLGPLRGHLAREYDREQVWGGGMNYMFFADPESFLDQLLVRFEMSYTPDKKFTNLGFSRDYIEEDEIAATFVFEKYQRFSEDFPATYLVLEYMYKSESDMFGRHLSGLNNDGVPEGVDGFHAMAFALQQASPSLRWRYDLSMLYDLRGGVYVQPGVRFKPNSTYSVEGYANIFASDGGNDDIIETVEWAQELGIRIGAQF